MPVQLQGILDSLPPIWPEELLPAIRREHEKRSLSIVVLDDDPTGTQTVYDVPVLTNWKLDTIIDEFERQTPLFYVLTNSRSLPTADAVDLALEAGTNILNASQQTGRAFEIISRSDSTLRGHFPAEVDALAEVLKMKEAVWVIAPFFEEGGRYTIDDIHYVKEEQHLIEAAKTAFAKDIVFGYRNSDLKKWVEEKTRDRIAAESVLSLSLADIREGGADRIADKLAEYGPGSVCVVNAVDYRDMEVATLGLLQARQKGQRFLFRTAASFVRVRAGLGGRPLLTADEMVDPGDTGGLVIVGSHVPRSSEQLRHVLEHENVQSSELNVDSILSSEKRGEEIRRSIECAASALAQGLDVVVYTARELVIGRDDESSLSIGQQVSRALVKIVGSLSVRPRYILAKGGITSSDIATQALGIVRAQVLGQILPGVPVWRTGPESRFPGMAYIVFPGNVGSVDAISKIVKGLKESAGQQ
ncbi:MAG: four-carbon acid sugar kinase family protein [Planctomycetota bacterium]|jgi:uncharacterized protein YgbK (DUF1537 family)